MIELEDRSAGTELAAEDERAAEEFIALLKGLPEAERDSQIKVLYKHLADNIRLLVQSNQVITSYQLALLTLAYKGDVVILDKDVRQTEGALEQRYDDALQATVYHCAPVSDAHRAEIIAEYEAEKNAEAKKDDKPS